MSEIDWQNVVAELMTVMTQTAIGEYCGCSQVQICDIHKGRLKEPRHGLGEKLLELHAATVKEAA